MSNHEYLMRQKFRAVFKRDLNALYRIQTSKLWKLVGTKQELTSYSLDRELNES
jgi:hypothetical protein